MLNIRGKGGELLWREQVKQFRILLFILFLFQPLKCEKPFFIGSSADSDFFPYLINLINTIHKFNFDKLGEIAVFDLGFTKEQINELKCIKKVSVHQVELTHPDLLKKVQVDCGGKRARGWYAWKPVVLKQALDMFPYILHLDAGLMVLKPLDEVFEHLWKHDYVLTGCGHSIVWMTPRHVIKTFDLMSDERRWILDESVEGLAGNFIGLTKNMQKDFVIPLYKLTHNLIHFIDDGTAPDGFGTSRHAQTLFSIQARLLGLEYFAWKDQARIVLDGKYIPCVYKDFVVRAKYVIGTKKFDDKKIRQYIRYKGST